VGISKLGFRGSHAAFCVAFPLALFAACNAVNIDRLAKWFRAGQGLDVAGLSAYLLAGACLLVAFFVLLAHPRTIKPLAIVLAVLSISDPAARPRGSAPRSRAGSRRARP
jgi:hypothetical protein